MTPEIQRARISAVGLLMGLSLWAAACAPTSSGPSPTAAPAKPAASPVPKAPEKPSPKADADAEWQQVVAAAKREGKVAVIGPQGTDTRDALTEGFQKKYPEIALDFNGLPGREVAPKLLNELSAGQNLTDVVIAGTTTVLQSLVPADAVQPIQPFLVGPATRDPSVWWGGKFSFADEAGRHNLVFAAYVKEPFVINSEVVRPGEFRSYRDLLDPKWKGRIVSGDPRLAGSALATVTFWYTTPALGKDFIRQLYTQQDVLVLTDDRQIIDAVGRGSHPVAVGSGDVPTVEAIRRGLPIRYAEALPEGQYITAGNGSVAVVTRAPHPDAAKVYLDHLLSLEGGLAWSKASEHPSLRRDVPTDHIPAARVPKDGVTYQENHKEEFVKIRDEIVDFLKTIIPGRA